MASLEQLRRQKPMTQRELAAAAGVSENTIWVIERGRHGRLRPRIMRAIAAALGVQPPEIDEFGPLLGTGQLELPGSREAGKLAA